MDKRFGKIIEWGKVIISKDKYDIIITEFTFDGEADKVLILRWAIDKLTKALAEIEKVEYSGK